MTSVPSAVNPSRLFLASCLSLIATSVAFGVLTSNQGQFATQFNLDGWKAGAIGGVTLWGFALSIFVLGPFVDAIGMKKNMFIAFACHLLGVLTMVFAPNFYVLFIGGLLIALGNGTVEAVCNPLVATLFPNRKTAKLSQFHVWFPGGIAIGGLLAFALDNTIFKITDANPDPRVMGLVAWQFKLLLVLIPTIAYGLLVLPEAFPKTERVTAGVTFGQMVSATASPLFVVMLVCMCLTASLELGPGRWMGTAMNQVMSFAGANAGILILVYGTVLQAVLRFFAGPLIHRLSPTGVLVMSSILGGAGLFLLSSVSGAALLFLAATVFYVGICYFWPTMLGFVAERLPRTGSLGLAVMGGMGMAFTGLVTTAVMGGIGDKYQHEALANDNARVVAALAPKPVPADGAEKATALQNVIKDKARPNTQRTEATAVLADADSYGMRHGFRWTALIAIPLLIVFGVLYFQDKAKGGYKAASIHGDHGVERGDRGFAADVQRVPGSAE